MDKSKTIINMARERLGNKPTYNPVEFLEMCAVVRDELESRPTPDAQDGATGAATLSGLYNCQVCGQEKCVEPGICDDCLAPPTEFEINQWAADLPLGARKIKVLRKRQTANANRYAAPGGRRKNGSIFVHRK